MTSSDYQFDPGASQAFAPFFEEHGFFAVDLLTDAEVAQYRREISAIIAGESPSFDSVHVQIEPTVVHGEATAESHELSVRKLMGFVGKSPVLTELAEHPRIVSIATALLGPDVKLLQDMALLKPPFFGSRKTWHQDCPYFTIDPPRVIGLWIALDDATSENGCMHIVPGSHRGGPIPHRQLQVEGESFEDFGIASNADPASNAGKTEDQDRDPSVDLSTAIPIPLKAGSALVFHGLMVHGTPPNRTPDRRRAVQLHYMDARCRYTGKGAARPEYRRIAGRDHEGAV